MYKQIVSSLLCLFCIANVSADLEEITADQAGYSEQKLNAIKGKLDPLVDSGRIPNYLVALAKNGKIFYKAIRGNAALDRPEPVTLDTIYWLASMSKPVVSTAVFQMIEEGKLSLEDPLNSFFPIFDDLLVAPRGSFDSSFEELSRPITIKDLLTHTSGFTYGETVIGLGDIAKQYDELGVMSQRHTLDENIELLAEVPLVAQPGTAFNYSVSIDVLGAILEKIEQKRLGQILRARIFQPLGMTRSGFRADDFSNKNIFASLYGVPTVGQQPIGRVGNGDIAWKIARRPSEEFVNPISGNKYKKYDAGGGGLWASADNYIRYLSMIADDGLYEGSRILGKESVQQQSSNLVPGLNLESFVAAFGEAAHLMSFGGGLGIKRESFESNEVDYYFWGGLCNTSFWIDPVDRSVGVFFTHHCPGQYNVSDELEDIVDGARL